MPATGYPYTQTTASSMSIVGRALMFGLRFAASLPEAVRVVKRIVGAG
jgi:hypothetical protein